MGISSGMKATRTGNSRFVQGKYELKHPEKYVGDVNNVRFMSSYELQTHQFFDLNPNILRWSSEEIAIPYMKPTDGRIHHYYPDYWIEYVNKDGEIIQEVIEVKPSQQTKAPRGKSKSSLYEQATYLVNMAKWDAAVKFCKQHGMLFRIITEKKIFK